MFDSRSCSWILLYYNQPYSCRSEIPRSRYRKNANRPESVGLSGKWLGGNQKHILMEKSRRFHNVQRSAVYSSSTRAHSYLISLTKIRSLRLHLPTWQLSLDRVSEWRGSRWSDESGPPPHLSTIVCGVCRGARLWHALIPQALVSIGANLTRDVSGGRSPVRLSPSLEPSVATLFAAKCAIKTPFIWIASQMKLTTWIAFLI